MAFPALELNVVSEEDHTVLPDRKIAVDNELGIAVEVETVAVAVDFGDGKIGFVSSQRIVADDQRQPTSNSVSHIKQCMSQQNDYNVTIENYYC